jgi:hypothetical protein
MDHKKDIIDTAIENGSFKTLVAAVQAAGLVDILKGKGPFTLFTPKNVKRTHDNFVRIDGPATAGSDTNTECHLLAFAGRDRHLTFGAHPTSSVQRQCEQLNDEGKWLIALISDTGMGLSEEAGTHTGGYNPKSLKPSYGP